MKNVRVNYTILMAALLAATSLCDRVHDRCAVPASDRITGTVWQRSDDYGRKINIAFEKNGAFLLDLHSVKMRFNGSYTVSGSSIRIVDKYCGTKLPGTYRFNIENGNLHFKSLDDTLCERRKILSEGKWKPDAPQVVEDR